MTTFANDVNFRSYSSGRLKRAPSTSCPPYLTVVGHDVAITSVKA